VGPTMTIEPSDFPNGHGQNDHSDHDHDTILVLNDPGKIVKINRYFNNFNKFQQFKQQKKYGIVDTVMMKFGLTILTTEILKF
jgi:hypothetical protein